MLQIVKCIHSAYFYLFYLFVLPIYCTYPIYGQLKSKQLPKATWHAWAIALMMRPIAIQAPRAMGASGSGTQPSGTGERNAFGNINILPIGCRPCTALTHSGHCYPARPGRCRLGPTGKGKIITFIYAPIREGTKPIPNLNLPSR